MAAAKLYVCPLDAVHWLVEETASSHLVSVINKDMMPSTPAQIYDDNHLKLIMNDINTPIAGYISPDKEHMRQLVTFVRSWDRKNSLIIHCWAGISRSTAAAFVAMCALDPARDEFELAMDLRKNSPFATPNPLMVTLADQLLERDGRMVEAVELMGRGQVASCGEPFFVNVPVGNVLAGKNVLADKGDQ